MHLPPLYHWSPRDRRSLIEAEGLSPYKPATVSSGDLQYSYVCFCTDPQQAWGLSADMGWNEEVDAWDLWLVRLADGDEVHYLADFGPMLKEIRVHSSIPPQRCWRVGSRPSGNSARGRDALASAIYDIGKEHWKPKSNKWFFELSEEQKGIFYEKIDDLIDEGIIKK